MRENESEVEERIKQEELKLKQAEVRLKERELKASTWLSPIVIGLFAAAIGLIGNVIATAINSSNAQKLEHLQTQSNLVLEAIKTNGDANATCKNLLFFVSLGLLDDRNQAITGACPGSVQGIPSMSVGAPDRFSGYDWYPLRVQTMADNGALLTGVKIEVTLIPPDKTIEVSDEVYKVYTYQELAGTYLGTSRTTFGCTTDNKKGDCYLGMAPAQRFLAVLAQKEGYAATRMNILFRGTSVDVVLQKIHAGK